MTSEEQALLDRWNGCGYYRLVGMEVVAADARRSRFRLTVTDSHLQAYGTAHGGVLAGLLDAAMGLAVLGRLPSDEDCATVEMKVNYLAPAPPGELSAEGEVLNEGRRLVLASAGARGGSGRLVAYATGTFLRVPRASG